MNSNSDDSGLEPGQPYRFPGGVTAFGHPVNQPRDQSGEVSFSECVYMGQCPDSGYCTFEFYYKHRTWRAYVEPEEAGRARRMIVLYQWYSLPPGMRVLSWTAGEPGKNLREREFPDAFCTFQNTDGEYVFHAKHVDGSYYTFRRRLCEMVGMRMILKIAHAA